MQEKQVRRSDRVWLSVPITVSGTDFTGDAFVEQTKTLVISRHGATIVLSKKLNPEQGLTIRPLSAEKEAEFRVVGQMGGQAVVSSTGSPYGNRALTSGTSSSRH